MGSRQVKSGIHRKWPRTCRRSFSGPDSLSPCNCQPSECLFVWAVANVCPVSPFPVLYVQKLYIHNCKREFLNLCCLLTIAFEQFMCSVFFCVLYPKCGLVITAFKKCRSILCKSVLYDANSSHHLLDCEFSSVWYPMHLFFSWFKHYESDFWSVNCNVSSLSALSDILICHLSLWALYPSLQFNHSCCFSTWTVIHWELWSCLLLT